MSRLIINKLIYNVRTKSGKSFGAEIPFKQGLNVIFGPNSVGKTSIVTGIIYGLGGEKSLGIFKSLQNPFKPEFYESINGDKVIKSYLLLEISNEQETVTIFRYIKGTDINIAAVKYCSANDFFNVEDALKLIISGDGVFTNNGFQRFLFKFIGLKEVELPTYDQKTSKLYFENILPLFFIEQRAGWSQIQSRQITRYNIKDVKKVAFEYLFNLDRFHLHLLEIELKETDSKLKKIKDELNSKEETIFVLSNAEKNEEVLIVNTTDIGKTSIHDYLRYLQRRYEVESKFINQLSTQNKDYEDSNEKLRDSLKTLDYRYRKNSERIDKISNEINGYQNYLDRIQSNKYKNKQLKKLREFSSEISLSSCPVCEAKLKKFDSDQCILCHNNINTKTSTPEQNLLFLEDEEKTFKKVISQRILDRRKIIESRNLINDKIKEFENQLDHQTKTYAGKEFAQLRKRIIDADSIHKEKERFNRILIRWNNLKPLRIDIDKLSKDSDSLKAQISSYEQTEKDSIILNTIKSNLQSTVSKLGLFSGKEKLISSIKLDEKDNYTPYLDSFDIYNISSSSDNIRIILSYYLSLLQTSIELNLSIPNYFPNLLILDEPKQQNLDNQSLMDCLKVLQDIPSSKSQVILTTYSEVQAERKNFDKHIIYEMKSKTDFLLKELK